MDRKSAGTEWVPIGEVRKRYQGGAFHIRHALEGALAALPTMGERRAVWQFRQGLKKDPLTHFLTKIQVLPYGEHATHVSGQWLDSLVEQGLLTPKAILGPATAGVVASSSQTVQR